MSVHPYVDFSFLNNHSVIFIPGKFNNFLMIKYQAICRFLPVVLEVPSTASLFESKLTHLVVGSNLLLLIRFQSPYYPCLERVESYFKTEPTKTTFPASLKDKAKCAVRPIKNEIHNRAPDEKLSASNRKIPSQALLLQYPILVFGKI